jgi:hypothetical protein
MEAIKLSMTISSEEYRQKLTAAFSPEILKALLLAVADAYRTTPEHCKRHFDLPDRHDLIGHIRRARIHEGIRGVAERFSLKAEDGPNLNGSSRFLSIFSGEIRMICCKISTKRSMLRPAKIRKVLAKDNYDAQHLLFGEDPARTEEALQHLAVLVHAPKGRSRDQAGFIDIVIPNRPFTQYMKRLELFSMFPAEIAEHQELFKRRKRRIDAEGA